MRNKKTGLKKYLDSGNIIMILIVVFMIFTMSFLVFGWVDSLFFGSRLSNYLAVNYHRYMFALISIPIYGIPALIMYFSLRSNKGWEEAVTEKIDVQEASKKSNFISTDNVEKQAKTFANTDEQFAQLWKRFQGYIYSFSGSGQTNRRQAIDLHSGGRSNMMFSVYSLTFIILPLILVIGFIYWYSEHKYNMPLEDTMNVVRNARPEYFYGILLGALAVAVYGVYRFIKSMTRDVVGWAYNAGAAVLETEPAPPMQKAYNKFLTQKMQFINSPWRKSVYLILIAFVFLPFVVGLLWSDVPLAVACGAVTIIAFFLLYTDNGKEEAFRVSKDWIRLINKGHTTDFSLNDCEEVIVHYMSNRSNSVRLSSTSAAMRDIGRNILTRMLDAPELIPAAIAFHRKQGEPVVLPLRCICDETGDPLDSHEVEFWFAYWLKEHGWQFELAPSDEDAGDWQAYPRE